MSCALAWHSNDSFWSMFSLCFITVNLTMMTIIYCPPFREILIPVLVILAFPVCCEIGFPLLLWLWFKSSINHHNPILERKRRPGAPPPSQRKQQEARKILKCQHRLLQVSKRNKGLFQKKLFQPHRAMLSSARIPVSQKQEYHKGKVPH